MTTRVQDINRLEAVDRLGQRYTIIESTTQMSVSIMPGTTIWMTQNTCYRALDHGPVNKINESEFVVFLTGEKLKRV